MRHGEQDVRWVRPLQGIIALFGGETLNVSFSAIESGNRTREHRFHAPDGFEVAGFADYSAKLEKARVVLRWRSAPFDDPRSSEGRGRVTGARPAVG
ncbi:MAG: glycine--tRNA ligase subunit beta [Geminicoccaceae bacterium]